MTTFALILLVVFPIVAIVVWLLRKEGARRLDTATKEAEFLAAMRANPTATVGPAAPAPIAPLIVSGIPREVSPVAPIPTHSPSVEVIQPSPPVVVARVPTSPPKDGHCLVCGESVDMRSNDASRWGVKIPEPGADRLIWVHFHCLAARLEEARAMCETMEQLVIAIDAQGAHQPALEAPLAKARALTGR